MKERMTYATDERLMIDLRAGSRSAGETLFERYRGPVWRFFRRRVADAGRAEELAHDTFVALLEGQDRYEPRAPFRSYLFGIAYRILLADRRKHAEAMDPLDVDPPAPAAPAHDDVLWVRAALQRLDRDDRDMLMLREYEQLSYQEIAALRRLPLNTVRSRLFRARMALKAALEAQGGDRVRHG
jgi:RNA polymerase sigma-70 factor (ECF subfamily)